MADKEAEDASPVTGQGVGWSVQGAKGKPANGECSGKYEGERDFHTTGERSSLLDLLDEKCSGIIQVERKARSPARRACGTLELAPKGQSTDKRRAL